MAQYDLKQYDLERFVRAQNQGDAYAAAVRELRRGAKTSHWMWFVFPQVAGLGRSAMAQAYAIGSLAEAQAYLDHSVLGARLRECAAILTDLTGHSATAVFGGIDAIKLRSSLTLFHRAALDEPVFARALEQYFAGDPDPETDRLLAAQG